MPYNNISGEIRNDFYVTLKTADLEKGNKKSARNVEVRVTVVNEEGVPIEVSSYMLYDGWIIQHCTALFWKLKFQQLCAYPNF